MAERSSRFIKPCLGFTTLGSGPAGPPNAVVLDIGTDMRVTSSPRQPSSGQRWAVQHEPSSLHS